jgi:hypothetical protein
MTDTRNQRLNHLKGSAANNTAASAVGADTPATIAIFPELLTPRECADYRRCSIRKLDRERAEGRGCPYVRIDGRIFYRRGDVDQFIESHLRLAGQRGGTLEERAI